MKPLKVGEVNNYIKRIFAGDMILSNIQIEGEISNFKSHYSGHMYFSLKDDKGKIRCVFFKSDNENMDINIQNGDKVVASGYISVYEKEGDYQLYIRSLKAVGLGDLFKAFEELKKKLESEGLFKEENKKPLPHMPKKIGVVTSATGAAIRDIITIIRRRHPACEILIYPALVQGPNAPRDIIKGLIYLDNRVDIDLIIVGRGGGSLEELFAFNDEELARTIYGLKTPVISAVGHETDFTISDFVADLRAATPSAAAELAVPNLMDLKRQLIGKYNHLLSNYNQWIISNKKEMQILSGELKFNSPVLKLKDRRQEVDNLIRDIIYEMDKKLNNEHKKLMNLKHDLSILNPSIGLDSGYGIILDEKGHLIRSIEGVSLNDNIQIMMKDGKINTKVWEIHKEVCNED